jgi:hypothetical protein
MRTNPYAIKRYSKNSNKLLDYRKQNGLSQSRLGQKQCMEDHQNIHHEAFV